MNWEIWLSLCIAGLGNCFAPIVRVVASQDILDLTLAFERDNCEPLLLTYISSRLREATSEVAIVASLYPHKGSVVWYIVLLRAPGRGRHSQEAIQARCQWAENLARERFALS